MTALVALIQDKDREDQENNDFLLSHLHDLMSDRLAGRPWERVTESIRQGRKKCIQMGGQTRNL